MLCSGFPGVDAEESWGIENEHCLCFKYLPDGVDGTFLANLLTRMHIHLEVLHRLPDVVLHNLQHWFSYNSSDHFYNHKTTANLLIQE